MPVARIDDPKRVFASLSLERERSAILAAFLGSFESGDGAWAWRAGGATNISFVVYLAHSPLSPIVFGYGPPSGIDSLLSAAMPVLPPRLLLHFPVAQRDAFARLFTLEVDAFTSYSLVSADLAEPDRTVTPVELAPGMGEDLAGLLAHDPVSAFQPEHLRGEPLQAGIALGLRESGRLVGVASAPIVSGAFPRAVITHLVIAPEERRKGIAAALHFALARRLFDEGIEVIGMMARDGIEPAHALLASLGYIRRGHVLFGAGVLRGTHSALISTGEGRSILAPSPHDR